MPNANNLLTPEEREINSRVWNVDNEWERVTILKLLDTIQQLRAERDQLASQVGVMQEALQKCTNRFGEYEVIHRAKKTNEGNRKAEQNRKMVQMIAEVAVTPPPAALARIQAEAGAKALEDAADYCNNDRNTILRLASQLRAKSLSYMSEVTPKVEPNESSKG